MTCADSPRTGGARGLSSGAGRACAHRRERGGRITHGASLAVRAATRADRGNAYDAPVVAAPDRLLTAGKEAERLSPGAYADEVVPLVSLLWKTGGPDRQERGERKPAMVIDGLPAGR
ncbi:hypothetical protein ACFYQ5_08805 [Streptomyces sp. NPDC005794]|uniref:hypothetical protein n=1 Tax=Streptomyces sp. NPDC005794 TaxID=3364733 RepID=UPI003677A630